nr:S8 family peptidase [uncultured Sandarakinorhabdus sp.]
MLKPGSAHPAAVTQSRLVPSLALALLLAGCGGAGGGGVGTVPAPPPAPTPAPAPPPAPTPTPSAFDTVEYRRSNGAVQVQALAAYDRGFSGSGIMVAVIDSGVNPALAEFSGRISPASRDVAAARAMADERGHGTSVTGILLAARNGVNMHGVAPQATLLALRADTPGSCDDQGCSYASPAIAAGLQAAADARARVVNMSLGGGSTTAAVRAAAGQLASAGSILVLSAGNEGLSTPQSFANQLIAVSQATTIVVGAVNASNEIASFSNRAGVLAPNYLVAPGVELRSFNQDGATFLYSGTSVAAPVVSGAAALLAQAFPALSGAQIVDILLRSADDLGATGTDEIYGRGLLNIARAFQPLGTSSIGGQPVAITTGGSLGAALGDGGPLTNALAGVVIEDGYGRPFTVDLAQGLVTAPPGRLAAQLLATPVESAVTSSGGTSTAFALLGDSRGLWAGDRATMAALAPGQQRQASPVGHVRLLLSGGSVLVAGHGQAVAGLVALADPSGRSTALITADPALPLGSRPLGAAALSQPLGGGFTLAAGFGQSVLPAQDRQSAALQSTALFHLSRAMMPGLELAALLRVDAERGSLMGTRLSTGFGLAGGTTTSLGLSARLALGPRARLSGEWRRASSRLDLAGGGLIAAAGRFSGDAASAALALDGVAAPGDTLTLAITRPLALTGPLWLLGTADPVRVGPALRETAAEALYALPFGPGQVQFSLFHRSHPGHIVASPDDDGAAVRFHWRW